MTTTFNKIVHVFLLPSYDDNETTLLQGLSSNLMPFANLMSLPAKLPSSISEIAMDQMQVLASRCSGFGGYFWTPVESYVLKSVNNPFKSVPHLIIYTADSDSALAADDWINDAGSKAIHVSFVDGFSRVSPEKLTVATLEERWGESLSTDAGSEVRRGSNFFTEILSRRPSSLRYHSHNVTVPNEMVLYSAGEARAIDELGVLQVSPHQNYVDGITESCKSVLAVRDDLANNPFFLIHPLFPDIFLFAPSTFRGLLDSVNHHNMPRPIVKCLKALERQDGYILKSELEPNTTEIPEFPPLLWQRVAELKTQTMAVGLRAASTMSATIRLPNRVNRTAGVIAQFSRHIRHFDKQTSDRKTARVFKLVQQALIEAIPREHLELLKESRSGIKIISDAPLEWLPIDGLPLGLRMDVSRINVTPGNMLIQQLVQIPPQAISPAQFKNFLAVSMFKDGDSIAYHLRLALELLNDTLENHIGGTSLVVSSKNDFIESLSQYDGPLLIVDCHADHPKDENVGKLRINDELVDIWSLHELLKVPPIVILSACDTHPFDRSHASVANGFLKCGAVAVLATVLPIRASSAAIFLAKLIRRVVVYADKLSESGFAISWASVVSSTLRMQLAYEVVTRLVARKVISVEQSFSLNFQANCDINASRTEWFEKFSAGCMNAGGLDTTSWNSVFDDFLAGSDVIRYVHLGNPESIIVADERVSLERLAQMLKFKESSS